MAKVALVAHWDWVLYNFRLPIARRLRELGHEVLLVCPPGRYVEGFRTQGFAYVRWDVDRRSFRPLVEARAVKMLTSIYRTETPDVVHHFTIKPNLYGTVAARWAMVPLVINTFSGMGFFHTDSRQARALRILIRPVMRAIFRSNRVWTIFQNEDDFESAIRRGLARRDQTRLIPGSGVDVDLFKPQESSRPPGPPIFLMAARLLREKGVHEFVAAARRIRQEGVAARFIVAGEQDKGNPSTITDTQLVAWKHEGIVEFLGHVSDMPGLIARCDVAVLPTYYPEGLPRFLLEAAATGLPLVATDIPPCRPIVQEGYNGHLIATRDEKQLAESMLRLAQDEPRRIEFGRNARRLVVDRFREQDIVEQYMDLYQELHITGG